MNLTFGLMSRSSWADLVKPVPVEVILPYVHAKWIEFSGKFSGIGEPLQKRDEPTLTKGLAAYLSQEHQNGKQPFPGDFLAELPHYDLEPDGSACCTARTDIEWRLYGTPCFIVEFKILDGSSGKRTRYLSEGVSRFVAGRYGPQAETGAMFAFLRAQGLSDPEKIEALLTENASSLNCFPQNGPHVQTPSKLAPATARFDSSHSRSEPFSWPLVLAHVFVVLPS